ncbi:uncharacterized protein LOC129597851 isoform X2 [Paramacrobiotus metropolitanus]|uniref:uncharacterized protein LOC129597851 isoform X2 n=1 Tax=Paramacrobiotus metropolitanus TaxID=2943436 RepID=UPI0024458D9B|nr:uncharacterized protein LOC129597851 isoform X2 [Paramacrobiotus metropolitanus]
MPAIRLGIEIGFRYVGVTVYDKGVPSMPVPKFPAVAAFSAASRTEWYFGLEARGYRTDPNFEYRPNMKAMLLDYGGHVNKDPILPELLHRLFAYVKARVEIGGQNEVHGVAVVLPHSLQDSTEMHQLVVDAWQLNNVSNVFCISDTTAILLAYIAQTLDRNALKKYSTEDCHLIVCNANEEHFQVDVFEIVSDNYVVKYQSAGTGSMVRDCLRASRHSLLEMVYKQLQNAGMRPLTDPMRAEFEKDWLEQIAQFHDPRVQQVNICSPAQDVTVTITREMHDMVLQPITDIIEQRLTAELRAFGIMNPDTLQCGIVEIVLVGENSRLLLLRRALEKLKKPLNKMVSSYVDDAEAFGAAIASYVVGNAYQQQQLYRLQEGLVVNMDKILAAIVPSQETSVARPVRDIFVNSRPPFVLSGQLCTVGQKDIVSLDSCSLILSTKLVRNANLHYIEVVYSDAGQKTTYMRMLVDRSLLLHVKGREQTEQTFVLTHIADPEHTERTFLVLRIPFRYHGGTTQWCELWFLADDPQEYDKFIDDYASRLKEMTSTVASEINGLMMIGSRTERPPAKSIPMGNKWHEMTHFVAL